MLCVAKRFWSLKNVRRAVGMSLLALLSQSPALAVQNALLSWNPSSEASVVGYKVYYGPASGNYTSVLDAGSATNVTISGLADGSTNYFAATSYDAAANESPYSAEVVLVAPTTASVTTNLPPALNIVSGLSVGVNAALANSAIVSWNASADAGVAGYQVYYGTASGNYPNVVSVGLATSLVVTGLVAGTTYYFSVREYDAAWDMSAMSPEVVWFNPILTNAPPTLDAIASQTVSMNSGAQTVALTGISCGSAGENQTVKITAASSRPGLIPNPTVIYQNPNRTGSLVFKPSPNATGTATITVTVDAGGTSKNSVKRSFTVTVFNLAALPKIARAPQGAAALPGKNISLSVAVAGQAPFRYQWRFNGTNLPGANGATLTLKKVKAANTGAYSVLVSNDAGLTNSPAAMVTVITNTAPLISTPVQRNGQFSFQITGVPGGKYVVEASSDLRSWGPVQTNTAPFTFTDTNVIGFNQKFYRSFYLP